MIRHLLAGAAGIAAVAALTVAPAEAAAFGVTLKTDTTKADVNKTFRLSGKVTGSGAANKKIIVQRKIGSAAWKDYSTITTRPTGTYAKEFTMASVGVKKFRVLVPKTSKLTTGTSNTKTVTGYTWLALASQPHQYSGSGLFNVDGRVNGTKYPRSVVLQSEGNLFFNLDDTCDRVAYGYGLDERQTGAAEQPFVVVTFGDDGQQLISAGTADIALASVKKSLGSGTAAGLYFGRQDEATPSGFVALTTPKVHCSVNQLPEANFAL